MNGHRRKTIPIAPATDAAAGDSCSDGGAYALMVLGDSMLPEFAEGEVIVVEPEGLAGDGSYVIAWHGGEHIFRQLVARDGRWWLHPLNPAHADAEIPDLSCVRGVILQKQRPDVRRSRKRYIE
ncbi:MAG: S24 family peptidase [Betaproteobacteria bacterium]|nr:S24 family peptidase [Betaproteobacteria bacterium]